MLRVKGKLVMQNESGNECDGPLTTGRMEIYDD